MAQAPAVVATGVAQKWGGARALPVVECAHWRPREPAAPPPFQENGRGRAPTDFDQMDMVPGDRVQIRVRPDLGLYSVCRSACLEDSLEKVLLMSEHDSHTRSVDVSDCVFLDPQPYEVMARDVVENIT